MNSTAIRSVILARQRTQQLITGRARATQIRIEQERQRLLSIQRANQQKNLLQRQQAIQQRLLSQLKERQQNNATRQQVNRQRLATQRELILQRKQLRSTQTNILNKRKLIEIQKANDIRRKQTESQKLAHTKRLENQRISRKQTIERRNNQQYKILQLQHTKSRQQTARQKIINSARQLKLQNQLDLYSKSNQQLRSMNNRQNQSIKKNNETNFLNIKAINQKIFENRKRKADQLLDKINSVSHIQAQKRVYFSQTPIQSTIHDGHSQKIVSNHLLTHSPKNGSKQITAHKADELIKRINHTPISFSLLDIHKTKQKKSEWRGEPAPIHFSSHQTIERQSAITPKVSYIEPPVRQSSIKKMSSQQKEKLAEDYAINHFVKNLGYELLQTKIRSNNGIDTFFVKRNLKNQIISVAVVESKFSSSGKVILGNTKTKGIQMTYGWLKETLKLMENDLDSAVQETAAYIKAHGNAVLDSRFVNLMTPDGNVKWFRIIKKNYDTRNFIDETDDLSDGEIYQMKENDIPNTLRYWDFRR